MDRDHRTHESKTLRRHFEQNAARNAVHQVRELGGTRRHVYSPRRFELELGQDS